GEGPAGAGVVAGVEAQAGQVLQDRLGQAEVSRQGGAFGGRQGGGEAGGEADDVGRRRTLRRRGGAAAGAGATAGRPAGAQAGGGGARAAEAGHVVGAAAAGEQAVLAAAAFVIAGADGTRLASVDGVQAGALTVGVDVGVGHGGLLKGRTGRRAALGAARAGLG